MIDIASFNKALKVSPQGFNSARTDDASFCNVRALADASSGKPQYSSNYSPEVETEKPFKKNVKETIWKERSCVYFDETAIVELLIDKTAWFENSRMLTQRSQRVPILMTQLPLR